MSDFLVNLVRRAVGDKARGAEIAPSPQAALAERMALPAVAAPEPAPPPITAVPTAAAPVMREVAQAPSPPPAAPASPPGAVRSTVAPAATQPEAPVRSVPAPAPPVIPASIDRGEAAVTVAARPPQDSDRSFDSSNAEAPRVEPRSPDVPPAAFVSLPSVDVPPEVVVRIVPPQAAGEVSRAGPAAQTLEFPQILAPRAPVHTPAAPSLEPARVEPAPIEHAPVVPRVERPPDALVPVARPEPATPAAASDPVAAQHPRAAAAARRPVEVRIGAIEVQVTAPPTPAPAERPALAGFEEYAAVRNSLGYDGE